MTPFSADHFIVKASIKAVPEGPQVVFQRAKITQIELGDGQEIIHVEYDAGHAASTTTTSRDLAHDGWRMTEDEAAGFLADHLGRQLAMAFEYVSNTVLEISALANHGKPAAEQRLPPTLPIIGKLVADFRERQIWGFGAVLGDPRIQVLLGTPGGESPQVTVTLAPLSRPVESTDLDAPTPFDFERCPAIALRFRDNRGIEILQNALVQARERLAEMNLAAERRRSLDLPRVVEAKIPIEDISSTGLDKVLGGKEN